MIYFADLFLFNLMVAKDPLQLVEKFVMVYRIEKKKYQRKGLVSTIIGLSLLSLMILSLIHI